MPAREYAEKRQYRSWPMKKLTDGCVMELAPVVQVVSIQLVDGREALRVVTVELERFVVKLVPGQV